MKKFRFALDTVLDYKDQVLDALRAEHGAVLARVRAQERRVEEARTRYQIVNEEFREKKRTGMTVADAMSYDSGLRVLDGEIRREELKLAEILREEAAKRTQVVEARKDTASLEKLRERKLQDYNKAVTKSEELFIEEFVSSTRAMALQAAH